MTAKAWMLYKDHASLHSAGRALRGEGTGEIDVLGLLNLGTQLVFAEELKLNGFEHRHVAEISQGILTNLKSIGVDNSTIHFSKETKEDYASCCLKAANYLAQYVRHMKIDGKSDLAGGRPDLSDGQNKREAELLKLLNAGKPGAHDMYASPGNAVGAAGYMFTASQDLWDALTEPRSNHPSEVRKGSRRWTLAQIKELIMVSRFYLNAELADFHGGQYSPAVKRAMIIRYETNEVFKMLARILSDEAKADQSSYLGAPRIARALVTYSMGDPGGVIATALEFRQQARELRQLLALRAAEIEKIPTRGRRSEKLYKETAKLAAALDYNINKGRNSPLDEMLIHFHLPRPRIETNVDIKKIRQWWYGTRYKKILTVLTSASLIDERERQLYSERYDKLLRNSCRLVK